MKAASGINWNLAKVLRGQGFTWDEIADKTGAKKTTLQVRASREGWTHLNKEGAKAMQELATEQTAAIIKQTAPKYVEKWLSEAQEETVEAIERLRKLPKPKNWKEAQTVENTMLAHVKRGRSIYGLDDQKAGATVQIAVMGNILATMDKPLQSDSGEIIDVPDVSSSESESNVQDGNDGNEAD